MARNAFKIISINFCDDAICKVIVYQIYITDAINEM